MGSLVYTSGITTLSLSNDIKTPEQTVLEIGRIARPLGFLDLPREIRDEIYSLPFLTDNRIVYPSKSRAGSISEAIVLLRTNKTIYSEAIEILYGRNMFQIRGNPAVMAPEFLHLLIFRQRTVKRYDFLSELCLARMQLKRLSIPSHGISLNQLKYLFSLLKHFPSLEHVQVIFLGRRGSNDMDFISICGLLRDRLPNIRTFILGKRLTYSMAEDISWTIAERPYRKWTVVKPVDPGAPLQAYVWRNENGEERRSTLMDAPQSIPE